MNDEAKLALIKQILTAHWDAVEEDTNKYLSDKHYTLEAIESVVDGNDTYAWYMEML